MKNRSLWFAKEGVSGCFSRCGKCAKEMKDDGIHVRVGNEVLAIVCGECFQAVSQSISEAYPHSIVDCDERGRLVVKGDPS